MVVVTYLVTFGTRNTGRTLRIRKRKKANELKLLFSCEFLVRSDIHSLSKGLRIKSPNCQVGGSQISFILLRKKRF